MRNKNNREEREKKKERGERGGTEVWTRTAAPEASTFSVSAPLASSARAHSVCPLPAQM